MGGRGMIAIKDMEMPKCCHWDCPLCNEDGGSCMLGAYAYDPKTDTKKERAKDCPLVEIVACEDCISRQAAIKIIDSYLGTDRISQQIKQLPSVTPPRKKGKWIIDPTIGCKCSKCGRKPYPYQTDSPGDDYWKPDYCPNCGIEIESEE